MRTVDMSSSPSGVAVIWDYQYYWIPEGYNLRNLKTSIETALKRLNPDFFIEGKLTAVGTATGHKHRAISMLHDDIELLAMPDYHTRGPGRDLADQAATFIVREITMNAFAKRTNILVISGNEDVIGAVNRWRRDIFMMLALPESSSSLSFFDCANVAWLWTSEDPESAAATMVNGGGPIPPPV